MMVEKTKPNLLKCKCKYCPSYSLLCLLKAAPGAAKKFLMPAKSLEQARNAESLFCAFGPSQCIKEKLGCICGSCPVYNENNLQGGYFCQRP
jgi:hypothetical protein